MTGTPYKALVLVLGPQLSGSTVHQWLQLGHLELRDVHLASTVPTPAELGRYETALVLSSTPLQPAIFPGMARVLIPGGRLCVQEHTGKVDGLLEVTFGWLWRCWHLTQSMIFGCSMTLPGRRRCAATLCLLVSPALLLRGARATC